MPKKKSAASTKRHLKHSRKKNASLGVIVGAVLVVLFIVYLSLNNIKRTSITTFEECAATGAPIMESYPRQCTINGKTFVESLDNKPPEILQIKKGTNDLDLNLARGNYVINSVEEWNKLFGNSGIEPEVNFEEKTVIAVVMGQKPSGGYSVFLKQIEVGENEIKFMIEERIPGENCLTTSALTNPYQIIAIEKTEKKIIFLGDTIVEDCRE